MPNKELLLNTFRCTQNFPQSAALNQNCQIFKEADCDENQHKR